MGLHELEKLENDLIAKFGKHPTLQKILEMSDDKFIEILLQKRFHSLGFTPLYDVAIDGIESREAKEVARAILREEYPQKAPSHREDLVNDIMKIGVERGTILNSNPTPTTLETMKEIISMLRAEENQELYDVKAVTVLRFWGEILVAEEYGKFLPRLEKMGLTKKNSGFYWPHYEHDRKKVALDDLKSEKRTHSDRLTKVLQAMLDTEEKIEYCAETEKKVYEIKARFYGQFK